MNEKMIAKFSKIALDRLQKIETLIMELEQEEENKDNLVILMRELHTLKGESRILNLIEMSELVHVIEDALLWRNNLQTIPPISFFDLLYSGLDIIQSMCQNDLLNISEEEITTAQKYQKTLNSWLKDGERDVTKQNATKNIMQNSSEAIPLQAIRQETSKATSLNTNPITRIVTILKKSTQSRPSTNEAQEIHTRMQSIRSIAPPSVVELADALHVVLCWVIDERRFEVDKEVFYVVFDGFEFLEALFQKKIKDPEKKIAKFLARLGEWLKTKTNKIPTLPPLSAPKESNQVAFSKATAQKTYRKKELPKESSQHTDTEKKQTTFSSTGGFGRKLQTPEFIQIEIEQVEALTNISGELDLSHAHIDKLTKDLDRITLDCTDFVSEEIFLIKRSHSISDGVPHISKWLKMQALIKEFSAHLNQLREDLLLAQINIDEFQHRISQIRLKKIEELFQRFPRAIRTLAQEQGKQIKVVLEGIDVSIDKTIIEELFNPILHLIRNSIDHGIETPELRKKAGKPPKAVIKLSAIRIGDSVKIEISDDGIGIDPEQIRETLLRKGLNAQFDVENFTDKQLFHFLFLPGFSTRQTVSQISGRGIGLDIVKSTVEKRGGSISMESTVGAGTTFTLNLPISVALSHALIVRIHEGYYAFPIQSVEEILIVERHQILSLGEGDILRLSDNSSIPIISLSALLEFDEVESSNLEETIIVIQSMNSKIGLRVDLVQEVRQLIQSNLSEFIRGHRIISGTAMLEGGVLVQFLNIVYLAELASTYQKNTQTKKQSTLKPEKLSIFIVEDSDLTREMLVSRVSRMGFIVHEAINGQDCWEQLKYREVDIIMTDLDMPIMNGFELIRNIRSTKKIQDIPIIVLSTRRTKESKQQAAQAGANAYVVKSAYNEEELLATFRRLLSERQPK